MSNETNKSWQNAGSYFFYAKNAVPVMEVKIDMITFMILLAILILIALIIGFVILIFLAIGGAGLGLLIYIFGDLVIGIALFGLLLRAIFRKRK